MRLEDGSEDSEHLRRHAILAIDRRPNRMDSPLFDEGLPRYGPWESGSGRWRSGCPGAIPCLGVLRFPRPWTQEGTAKGGGSKRTVALRQGCSIASIRRHHHGDGAPVLHLCNPVVDAFVQGCFTGGVWGHWSLSGEGMRLSPGLCTILTASDWRKGVLPMPALPFLGLWIRLSLRSSKPEEMGICTGLFGFSLQEWAV